VEAPITRWRREADEQEERFARERAGRHEAEAGVVALAVAALRAEFDSKLAQRDATMRDMLVGVNQALGKPGFGRAFILPSPENFFPQKSPNLRPLTRVPGRAAPKL